MMIPKGYRTIPTNDRVVGVDPELITRFRWRAHRRCRKLNQRRLVDFYRYEVRPLGKKWEVVAMQNRAEPISGTESTSEQST
jgi:hypothetical protein